MSGRPTRASQQRWRGTQRANEFRPSCISASSGNDSQEPAQYVLEECEIHVASEEEQRCREEAAELCCFVSFADLADTDSVLGLGLLVHKRTSRHLRLSLPPNASLTLDYLDVEAFNTGIYAAAARRRAWEAQPSMVSSSRGQLNAWLPLYMNPEHWARTRPYVVLAFAVLSGRNPDTHAEFRADEVLTICCSLMTRAAAGFTAGQTEHASPRTSSQSKCSDRAIQMYADVHRLLLQLSTDWPEIRTIARSRLRSFIDLPDSRTRDITPSLGDLVHCLLLVDDISWEDLKPVIVPEALRRHVWRQECKGQEFNVSPVFDGNPESLIRKWNMFAPNACMVLSFAVFFIQRVGRPCGTSVTEVMGAYDRRWGQLTPLTKAECREFCAKMQHSSLTEVLDMMGVYHSNDTLAEVLLWAVKHGKRWDVSTNDWKQGCGPNKEAAVPKWQWPELHDGAKSLPLLSELKQDSCDDDSLDETCDSEVTSTSYRCRWRPVAASRLREQRETTSVTTGRQRQMNGMSRQEALQLFQRWQELQFQAAWSWHSHWYSAVPEWHSWC